MATTIKPKQEPDPIESDPGVRSLLRNQRPGTSEFAAAFDSWKPPLPILVALGALTALLVIVGFAIGGGFSEDAAAPSDSGMFITQDQAEERLAQAAELHFAESQLAIVGGEVAFLEDEVSSLTETTQSLRSSLNRAEIEMSVIVAIYEECLDQRYPVECVEAARPRAEAFLDGLYTPDS